MNWKDLTCLCLFLLGVVLFLHGSNYYNAITGWGGVFLILGSIFTEIFLHIYESIREKSNTQKP
jgi:hypothetical protein